MHDTPQTPVPVPKGDDLLAICCGNEGATDYIMRWHGYCHAIDDVVDEGYSAERFLQVLLACEFDARGRLGLAGRAYPQRPLMEAALEAARSIDAGAIARSSVRERIAEAVRQARLAAVASAIGGQAD